jgi:hypothetical protein
LDRFRRAAAVPAAVGDELASELAPLFLVLDSIEEEAEELRAAARDSAGRRLAVARAEAAGIAARARERAEAARARAEAGRLEAREGEARALLAAAEEEARETRERGAARASALVEAVLACVKEGPE